MTDPVTDHNRRMWDRLAEAGHSFARPRGRLPRSPGALRRLVDPADRLAGTDLDGAAVLVLAGGGGWDGIALSLLGARVTLLDISERQCATVRRLARRRGAGLAVEQGDMKDLSRFRRSSFDVVWHMHSLVFVDDPERVFREVARVLRAGGTYWTQTMHPVTIRMYEGWTGSGWTMRSAYHDTGPVPYEDTAWRDGDLVVDAPTIEYGHTVERIVNGIAAAGMVVDGLWEWTPDPVEDPEPGSSEHVEATFPAFLEVRARRVRTGPVRASARRQP